jgi:hypothetical protein
MACRTEFDDVSLSSLLVGVLHAYPQNTYAAWCLGILCYFFLYSMSMEFINTLIVVDKLREWKALGVEMPA